MGENAKNGSPATTNGAASAGREIDQPSVATATAEPVATETPVAVVLAPTEAPVAAPIRIVEARVKSAAEPEFPNEPSLTGVKATTTILVTIGPTGRVMRTSVEKSSGYASLDRAATTAARLTAYYAPNIDGKPTTATYRMVYDFR